MTTRILTQLAASAALLGLSAGAQAASIYLLPSNATVSINETTATLELFMDFTGDPTLGGGIDLDLSGPISLLSFTPSDYFNALNTDALGDTDFTGFGTASADADFEIHFGSFAGLSGVNKLGDITVSLDGAGLGTIALAINSLYGDFFSTQGGLQDVTLAGATLQVVPVPAAAWFFVSALGVLGGVRLRRAA